jgi:DNA-binding CsgD family transcriptional regulator
MKILKEINDDFSRNVGLLSSLLALAFLFEAISRPAEEWPYLAEQRQALVVLYGLAALLFFASIVFSGLKRLLPSLLFLLATLECLRGGGSSDGLGCALAAAAMAMREERFDARPRAKDAAAIGALSLSPPLFFSLSAAFLFNLLIVAIYLLFVLALAQGRVLKAFAPPKRVLRLADYKLSDRERRVVRLRTMGMSVKEIAAAEGLAVSTVRNKLSFSYRKLGLEGSEALAALAERYTVE